MKNTITVQLRSFAVLIEDQRTGRIKDDVLVLSKEQLQAAQLVGQSSKELINRIYNREGYKVLDIGKAARKEAVIDLEGLFYAD